MDVSTLEGQRGRRRRRRTEKRQTAEAEVNQQNAGTVAVEKADILTPVAAPEQRLVGGGVSRKQQQQTEAPPTVVIAPPKKKPTKLLLVPKTRLQMRTQPPKTFKARRVSVVIDNTAKTAKRRRMTLQRVERLTEEQLREAAVIARLSRPETVAKVPADLLRQMLKDYYTMRGKLL